MKNTDIAVKHAEQMLEGLVPGGHLVLPMFPGITKHQVRVVKNGLVRLAAVDSVMIDKQVAVITKKGAAQR